MSKAFTKEPDPDDVDEGRDEAGDDAIPKRRVLLTPGGHQRLVDELDFLRKDERPKIVEIVSWAASNGDRSENGDYIYGKKRLREIDRRMRYLIKRLDVAEVVDPARQAHLDKAYFGATVIYEGDDGVEKTIKIVGEDEARHELGEVSWVSPIAKALMGAAEGDLVKVRTPDGVKEIEVVAVSYAASSGAQ